MPSSVSPSRLARSPSLTTAAHHFALDAASFRSSRGQKLVGVSHSQLCNGVVVQVRASFLLREIRNTSKRVEHLKRKSLGDVKKDENDEVHHRLLPHTVRILVVR